MEECDLKIPELSEKPLSVLDTIEKIEGLNIGDSVVVFDGTKKPPKHHRKKLGVWEYSNFVGVIRGFGASGGRYEVKVANSMNSMLVQCFGFSGRVKFARPKEPVEA